MSNPALTKVAASKVQWGHGYTAPTSGAFGGRVVTSTPQAHTVAQKGPGAGSVPITPQPGAPTWTLPAGGTPPAAPPPPSAPGTPNHVDPFFRPEDLLTQNNFWAQWNTTFADLDRQLADLQANTAFNRAMLADQHRANAAGINDNAAARGISQSSIRDGEQAQEQTNFTRKDQNLSDAFNRFGEYVKGQHNNFDTNIKPGFLSAEDQQAVQNAQDVNASYVPPPAQAAPTSTPTTPKPARPTVTGQSQQPVTPQAHAVVHHALGLIHAATGWGSPYRAPTSGAFGRPR